MTRLHQVASPGAASALSYLARSALIGMLLLVVVLFLMLQAARAHDFWINHQNYKSPIDGTHCCGKNDCFEFFDVVATPAGWLIKSLGETIPYAETLPSEDQKFWRCKRYDGTRRCFFAPTPSS